MYLCSTIFKTYIHNKLHIIGTVLLDDDNSVLPQEIFMCHCMFESICITEQEVIDILSIFPVNKVIGAHLICHKMLKATKFTIGKPIHVFLLFNRSLTESVFSYYVETS